MKTLLRALLWIASNALALYVASWLIPGFNINTNYLGYLEVGLVFGIINTFVGPILKLFSFPLIILSFGLLSAVINIALLYFTSSFFDFFVIYNVLSGIAGLVVISLVNSFLSKLFKD